jgi:hypothetical protein
MQKDKLTPGSRFKGLSEWAETLKEGWMDYNEILEG